MSLGGRPDDIRKTNPQEPQWINKASNMRWQISSIMWGREGRKINLDLFFSDTAGNLNFTTHLAGIWEGLMRHNAQCFAESFTALQREKSHCCQQTRLTIWWGVNIFSVTVCKHCFFHPSHHSEHTPLCIFMRPFLHGCKYSLLALFWELEECADQGPSLNLWADS